MSAATEAELRQRLSKLQGTRASGVRRVQIDDELIEYRSDAELASAIGDLERKLQALEGPRRSIIYPKVSKGY